MENQGSAKRGIQNTVRLLRKKRSFWAAVVIATVLLAALIVGLIARARGGSAKEAEITVQSAEAAKGSISTTVVGTGTLAGGASTDVVVPAGIKVKEVLVESGDMVEAGQILATLDEASIASQLLEVKESMEEVQEQMESLSDDAQDPDSTEYLEAKVLNGQWTELNEVEAALETLLETQAITADCAGTVDGVNVSADTEITQSSASSSGSSDSGNATGGSSGSDAATSGNSSGASQMSGKKSATGILLLSADVGEESAMAASGAAISECSIDVEAPKAGSKPQTKIEDTDRYKGTISWNCTTDTFQENTVYTATIKLTAKEGYAFSSSILPEVKGADVTSEVITSDAGESFLQVKAKFAKTGASVDSGNSQTNGQSGNTAQGSVSGDSGGNLASGSSGASASGTGSASSGGSSGDGGSASSEISYSVYEAAAFTIASNEEVTVSINVDELDILSVAEGQTAAVTLDALEGETFEGTITYVAGTASSGSSSAKYPVKITLKKTEDMKLGMSASATIHIDESEDAVLIPVNALQEKGDSAFVYTGQDSDGNLTDKVEVETGLSDGSQVEIISGLEEGDTVYYLKAKSTDSSEGFDMAGGQEKAMPDGEGFGGEMPDGMQMPNGNAPGGSGQGSQGRQSQ